MTFKASDVEGLVGSGPLAKAIASREGQSWNEIAQQWARDSEPKPLPLDALQAVVPEGLSIVPTRRLESLERAARKLARYRSEIRKLNKAHRTKMVLAYKRIEELEYARAQLHRIANSNIEGELERVIATTPPRSSSRWKALFRRGLV